VAFLCVRTLSTHSKGFSLRRETGGKALAYLGLLSCSLFGLMNLSSVWREKSSTRSKKPLSIQRPWFPSCDGWMYMRETILWATS